MPKFKTFANRKGKADQAKNNMFVKLAREIYVEARRGGADPEANTRLKAVISKARQFNMPNDNVERAIKKAAGDNDNVDYEEILYEGYGPGGAAIMVRCLTDNRNRTAADIRSIFNKRSGNMGESGCVSYMFDQKGVLVIDREAFEVDEDTIMMQAVEAGAADMTVQDDSFEILTEPQDFDAVKSSLEAEGYTFFNASIRWVPQTTVTAEGENADKLLKMMDAFEDNDDVQEVYVNFEIEDAEMERLGH